MLLLHRLRSALPAASVHLLTSLLVAAMAAAFVFLLWYPYPFRELAGGRELFLLIIGVDVVCGPLLTLVLFNPAKPRAELWRDMALVVCIQLSALTYGMWSVWVARPLYMVAEVDRFKVIAAPNLRGASLEALPPALRPPLFGGPLFVAIRAPKDADERNRVLLESVAGGPDMGERPDFYLPYTGEDARKSLDRARKLADFLVKHPEQRAQAQTLVDAARLKLDDARYFPVIGRQDWIALLDAAGQVIGYLKGDGF